MPFKIYDIMAEADGIVTKREKCCKGVIWMFRALVWITDLGIICWVIMRSLSLTLISMQGMFYAVYPEFSSSRTDECPNTSVYLAFAILTIKLVRHTDK